MQHRKQTNMPINYDLNNTGPEVQHRLDQVMPNKEDIARERQARIEGDVAVTVECKQYTDTEAERAAGVESNLQRQIDAIVSGQTEVDLKIRVLPDGTEAKTVAVFADGEDKSVELIATSNPTPADVTIENVGSAEGITRKTFSLISSGEEQVVVEYTAEFTVAGVSKGTRKAYLALVYPIYYGAGVTLSAATMTHANPKPSPVGEYNIEIGTGNHLYFEVPAGMGITRVRLWDNPSFPTDVEMHTVATERTGSDGSAYTAYESVSTFATGTHKFKVD